jgi:hypothetical protein
MFVLYFGLIGHKILPPGGHLGIPYLCTNDLIISKFSSKVHLAMIHDLIAEFSFEVTEVELQ